MEFRVCGKFFKKKMIRLLFIFSLLRLVESTNITTTSNTNTTSTNNSWTACNTRSECVGHVKILMSPFMVYNRIVDSNVSEWMDMFEKCDGFKEINNFKFTEDGCLHEASHIIDKLRVEKIQNFRNLQSFFKENSKLCETSQCHQVILSLLKWIEHLIWDTALQCGDDSCIQYMEVWHQKSKEILYKACHDDAASCNLVFEEELIRLNSDVVPYFFRLLSREMSKNHYCNKVNSINEIKDTNETCNNPKKRKFDLVKSEQDFYFSVQMELAGFDLSNLTLITLLVENVTTKWEETMTSWGKNRTKHGIIVGYKATFQFALILFKKYLEGLLSNMPNSNKNNTLLSTLITNHLKVVNRLLPLTFRWLPANLSITGIVFSSLLFVACIIIGIIALWVWNIWKILSDFSVGAYMVMLMGLAVTSFIRILFWTAGLMGFGNSIDSGKTLLEKV